MGSYASTHTARGAGVVGVRKPGTKPGTWTGAFVHYPGKITAIFEDNMDFVGNPTEQEAQRDLRKFRADGYLPMTKADIAATTGMPIDSFKMAD